MSEYGLKEAIDDHMPLIDEILKKSNLPIFNRFMRAASLFVDTAITDSSFDSNEELLKSEAFFKGIIPLINDWYWNKYGELAKIPSNSVYSGIITPYGQPVLIKIPAITRKVEIPNETAWVTFPDGLGENELISDMAQSRFDIEKFSQEEKDQLLAEFKEVVSLTRKINLNISFASGFDREGANLIQGIWGHIEKSISDILSFNDSKASVGCWDLHLAIEKTMKAYLKQVTGIKVFGHDLNELSKIINERDASIDFSKIERLPSDKDAIKLRYAELITNAAQATVYYKISLSLIDQISRNFDRIFHIENASFLLKVAPWAK